MNLEAILTHRESQICTGIVLGRCKKEIADELSISPRTVETEVRNVLIKINAKKSTEIVTFWFVTHFSIPFELLPKSIIAIVFLLIWLPYEFSIHPDALRSTRTRTKTERVRTRTGKRYNYILEL
jgi:DNA-binding CsgD family transcriptional regulator